MRLSKVFHDFSKPGSPWKTIIVATAASVGVGVGAFSLHDDKSFLSSYSNQRGKQHFVESRSKSKQTDAQSFSQFSTLSNLASSSFRLPAFISPKTALCAAAVAADGDSMELNHLNATDGVDPETYYYEKMRDPPRNLVDSHAIFGGLCKPGYVERFNIYRHVPLDASKKFLAGDTTDTEIVVADVRIGEKLNGHDGIVHGGIISLMLDDTFGWAYEAMCMNQGLFSLYSEEENGDLPYVVTANLNVNYRAPLPAGSDVVIRVRHEKTDGRKIFYSARMESHDGSVLYSESTALFITVQKQYLKN